jgi:hypothetical protein
MGEGRDAFKSITKTRSLSIIYLGLVGTIWVAEVITELISSATNVRSGRNLRARSPRRERRVSARLVPCGALRGSSSF